MDTDKRDKVFAQYVDQYLPIIERTLVALRSNQAHLHIPYAQFLFSVTEYFGLLYMVALGHYNKKSPNNFIEFLGSVHFPAEDRCKNKFLWFIRHGLMHQIFSKGTGVGTSPTNKLFFPDTNNGNNITLNLSYFDSKLMAAVSSLLQSFKGNEDAINKLYDTLIIEHYGFDDHSELEQAISQSFGSDPSKAFTNCLD